jgi:hypothetical protein
MTEVFELTYHGGGGFTYTEVWNMDVPKRRFNLRKINEHLDRIQQMRDEQQKKVDKNTDVSKLKLPDFVTNRPQDNPFVSKVKSKK